MVETLPLPAGVLDARPASVTLPSPAPTGLDVLDLDTQGTPMSQFLAHFDSGDPSPGLLDDGARAIVRRAAVHAYANCG